MTCEEGQDAPGSKWDYAMLAGVITAGIPFVIANLVILRHRHRPYLRAQGGAFLIVTSSISGLVWIAAALVANDHFSRKAPFLHLCPFWTLWAYLAFGLCPWLICFILRLHELHVLAHASLYHRYVLRTPTWLKMMIIWAPCVSFAIVGTIVHSSGTRKEPDDQCIDCVIKNSAWRIKMFLILPLAYYLTLVGFLFWSRDSNDYMMQTEHSHACEYSIMALVIYLLYGLDVITENHTKIPGRCFLTFCVCCLVFFNFWSRLGWPVFLCLFKDPTEMDKFEEDIRSFGGECLLKVDSTTGNSRQYRSFSFTGYERVLSAIDAAMSEAAECKEKIYQLEQRKSALINKIGQLRMSGNASPVSTTPCIQLGDLADIRCFSSYSRLPPTGNKKPMERVDIDYAHIHST